MKVVHIPHCFYPDPVGGTEVYVRGLSRSLAGLGVDSVIAAPTDGDSSSYFYEGIKIRRFGFSKEINDLSDLYTGDNPRSLREFAQLLDDEKPDIVHFHSLTYAVSPGIARESRKRKIPVVFTYHSPTSLCQSGFMMHGNNRVCSGLLDARSCTSCTLHRLNVPLPIANILAFAPKLLDSLIKKAGLSGKVFTALRMKALVTGRVRLLRDFLDEIDHFIILCDWTNPVLLRNKVPSGKISLIRHGIYAPGADDCGGVVRNIPCGSNPLKIAYLGRIDCTKGIDVAVKALMAMPGEAIELDIYGVMHGERSKNFMMRLNTIIKKDGRVNIRPPVPGDSIIPLLKQYHYLVVPSVWMETGPLVALEAFAAGIPVIGSDVGGIREIVRDNLNGILVPTGSVRAWQDVLRRVSRDRQLLERLRSGIKPPRTMDDVALETMPVYNKVLPK